MFHLLHASGTTPEGLCFEAIMKEIEPSSKDKDSYFLTSQMECRCLVMMMLTTTMIQGY